MKGREGGRERGTKEEGRDGQTDGHWASWVFLTVNAP